MYRRSDNPERSATPPQRRTEERRNTASGGTDSDANQRRAEIRNSNTANRSNAPQRSHGTERRQPTKEGNNMRPRTPERRDMNTTGRIPTHNGTTIGTVNNTSAPGREKRPIAQNSVRTGSAPYIHGQNEARRPQRRKRKAPLYIRILRGLYVHRRAVLLSLGIFVFAIITIPIAVYATAASTADEPDFEMAETLPDSSQIISSNLSGSAFDSDFTDMGVDKTEEDTADPENSDTAADEESSDSSATDDSSVPEEEETDFSEASTDENTPENVEPEVTEEPIPQFTVTIAFYDREPITCLTGPATLGDILYTAGYTLRDSDRPTVSLDEMIEGDSWIMIDSVTYESVTESEAIPFDVDTYEVQTVPRGTTQTVSAGVYGSKEKVYTVQYVNGVEVERNFEYEYISSYPVNQIDHYGTGGTLYASDGSAYSYSYYVNVRATYYSIQGYTASGLPTSNSVMAVDPSVFPLGTYVYVMNDYYDMGVKVAADTGGAVVGNTIDIWMDENHPYYYQFAAQGVCNMVAYVLD